MSGITRDESPSASHQEEKLLYRDAPKLVSLLKEMKAGLDVVTTKVEALALKVKENQYPTSNGVSYLEAKHLLLLSYCQNIVYYMLRKAKGLPISGHPVVRSLVEIRLFLEKIRPIDKKLEYQIQKLVRAASNVVVDQEEKKDDTEDPLSFRPNSDMLVSKSSEGLKKDGGVYSPTRFAPTIMDEDKVRKEEKQAIRKEKQVLRQAKQSAYLKELLAEVEGRPDEIRETFGSETSELKMYKAKLEERACQEEELFTRAPITKHEKKMERRLLKSRNGSFFDPLAQNYLRKTVLRIFPLKKDYDRLQGLTDDFYDEIRTLPFEGEDKDEMPSYLSSRPGKKYNKRKRKH